jgi:hypothetical protein
MVTLATPSQPPPSKGEVPFGVRGGIPPNKCEGCEKEIAPLRAAWLAPRHPGGRCYATGLICVKMYFPLDQFVTGFA